MDEPTLPSPGDLIRVTFTIGGIAVALAALTIERGPTVGGVHVLPVVFLAAGIPAVVGSLFAMAELFWEAGLSRRELVRLKPADEQDAPYTREAILYTAWSLFLLLAGYVVLFLLVAGL
jgi:hypothetical protein